MILRLNGQEHNISEGTTIGQLLESLKLSIDHVVIELNREILNPLENRETHLLEGDRLEIIQFVGGG